MDAFEKTEEHRIQDTCISPDEKPELRGSDIIWEFSHENGDPLIELLLKVAKLENGIVEKILEVESTTSVDKKKQIGIMANRS